MFQNIPTPRYYGQIIPTQGRLSVYVKNQPPLPFPTARTHNTPRVLFRASFHSHIHRFSLMSTQENGIYSYKYISYFATGNTR